jgi:putative ABC transport system substrate-binding protein
VFAPVNDPVGDGFIASMTSPGGFITGIKNSDSISKSLEWLLKIVPNVKRIFVPHNPTDPSSVHSVEALQAAADTFGIELVIGEADTPDTIAALARDIPENIDAVFIVRSGTISAKVPDFVLTANELGIPVFASTSGEFVDAGVMMAYGSSYYSSGKQAARLANQILRGASPATLPAEEAESLLGINLKTAETIGVEIPDDVLRSASQVVRG